MKKFGLMSFMLVMFATTFVAAQSTARLDVFKVKILGVLNELKLSASFGKDNLINLIYNGDSYSLMYTEEDENLYFGSIYSYQKYSEDVTSLEISNFNAAYNYKSVKIIDEGDGYFIKSEFFFDDERTLKAICPKLLNTITRASESLKRSINNSQKDSLLYINEFGYSIVSSDSTSYSINTIAKLRANYQGRYVLGVRIYKNNCLVELDDIDDDFSRLDTLNFENTKPFVNFSTSITDTLCTNDHIRYELWYNENCITSKIIKSKTIE